MKTKGSATLRYLESHEVFTLQEFMEGVDSTVSERTRYANLQNALAREQAYRLRRGLYASNLGVYRDRVPNVFLVGAKAAPDAVLTHHSALEAHGVAHSPLRTVYFTTSRSARDFEARGYRFRSVAPPKVSGSAATLNEFVTRVRTGDAIVPVSTRERTVVDCLRDVRLAGGLEELLRSLGGFTSMSAQQAARYASLLKSPSLLARTGWVLSMFADVWQVDDATMAQMRALLGRGTYWLVPSTRRAPQEFISSWRLYVPADLPYRQWVSG